VEEKWPLFEAEDEANDAQDRLADLASETVATLTAALGHDSEHAEARELLADYYWRRLEAAEAAGESRDVRFFEKLVLAYHDGKYEAQVQGDGALTLDSDPPGAEVWLHEFVEEKLVLHPRNPRLLGATPLPRTALPRGSWLVVLKKEGYRDTRYPVCITRNKAWSSEAYGPVHLCTEEEMGAGFIHVPAGPLVLGGDPDSATSLPRSESLVTDFFLAEQPVTMEEYLQFLNDLVSTDGMEAAKGRSPRYKPEEPGSSYLLEGGEGGLKLPEVDAEGDRWDLQFPVFGINWHDANAYCAWRSARDDLEYRLPTEQEWEKAARGLDGGAFPWGDRFDPARLNSHDLGPFDTVPVGSFPAGASPFGVLDAAGQVYEWTSTLGAAGRYVVKGGSWDDKGCGTCRPAGRHSRPAGIKHILIGFRLVLDAPNSAE